MNSANAGNSEFDPTLGAPPPVEPNLPVAEPKEESNPEAWRTEVAARLARFRKRRKPRGPRYPSLHLPFDSAERGWFFAGRESKPASSRDETGAGLSEADGAARASAVTAPAVTASAVTASPVTASPVTSGRQDELRERLIDEPEGLESAAAYEPELEFIAKEFSVKEFPARDFSTKDSSAKDFSAKDFSRKIIEFPRAAAIPVMHPTPLADPICDRPRIVEAPEIVPPAPALGGIMMEPVSVQPAERTVRAEAPVAGASISERVLAAMVDGVILMVSLSAIGWIFLRFNPIVSNPLAGLTPVSDPVSGPIVDLAATAAGLAVVLWMAYEFLFVVATGSTPGLRALGLKLTTFDGSATDRPIRRWRVLATFLSAFSAGLGFVWCLLDEDSLCWHDRITRTHIKSLRGERK